MLWVSKIPGTQPRSEAVSVLIQAVVPETRKRPDFLSLDTRDIQWRNTRVRLLFFQGEKSAGFHEYASLINFPNQRTVYLAVFKEYAETQSGELLRIPVC